MRASTADASGATIGIRSQIESCEFMVSKTIWKTEQPSVGLTLNLWQINHESIVNPV